ncbi:MAG: hypothetical protein AAFX99_04810 [Myxococcota bacterium]
MWPENARVRTIGLACTVAALAWGCGGEVSGDEVTVRMVAQGATETGDVRQFVNTRGWEVELARAQALIGPIYMYSGEARASLMERLLGVGVAHACAAHAQFQSGRTLAEAPQQFGLDLLGGESVLVESSVAEAGVIRSVELHVQNPGQVEAGNTIAASNPEATWTFEGLARKDGVEIPFEIALTLPEEGTHQIVDSIPANMTLEEGATLKLAVQLDRLFRDVDFESMATGELEPGTQAYNALLFSLRSRAAFVWSGGP